MISHTGCLIKLSTPLFFSTDLIAAHLWLDGFEHRSIHECNLALEETKHINCYLLCSDWDKQCLLERLCPLKQVKVTVVFYWLHLECLDTCSGEMWNEDFWGGKVDKERPLVVEWGRPRDKHERIKIRLQTWWGNMLLFDFLGDNPEQRYSSQQRTTSSTEMWLVLIHSCHGKFVQRQPGEIHQCLLGTAKHHQLLLIQTLTPFPPLSSRLLLPQVVNTSHLCLPNISFLNTPTS